MSPSDSRESCEVKLLNALWQALFGFVGSKSLRGYQFERFAPGTLVDAGMTQVTISDLVRKASHMGLVSATLRQTLAVLQEDWNKLEPSFKAAIHELAHQQENHRIIGKLPALTHEDRADLSTCWYVADSIFFDAKRRALADASVKGFDSQRREIHFHVYHDYPKLLDFVEKLIGDLTSLRAELDLGVIAIQAIQMQDVLAKKVARRVDNEIAPLIGDWTVAISDAAMFCQLTAEHAGRMRERLEKFVDSVSTVVPKPTVLAQVREAMPRSPTVTNISISGDGNVVGHNNVVIARISKELERKNLHDVADSFGFLKGEVVTLDGLSEKCRRQALRAIEDAEDEVADKTPNVAAASSALKRVKVTLENAGAVFDSTIGWGKRFVHLGDLLSKYFPGFPGVL